LVDTGISDDAIMVTLSSKARRRRNIRDETYGMYLRKQLLIPNTQCLQLTEVVQHYEVIYDMSDDQVPYISRTLYLLWI
jgi:hypothetical protein